MKIETRITLAKLGLLAVVSLVCLGLVEFSLRMIYANQEPPYSISPGAGKTYSVINPEFTHSVTTNSLNFRDEEIIEKQPDEHRVLFIGDSFTFGLGVEMSDVFHSRMERTLTFTGKRINAINLGGKARGFRETGEVIDEFEPDAIVAQIFIGNDFYDLQVEVARIDAEKRAANSRANSGDSLNSGKQGGDQFTPGPLAVPFDPRGEYRKFLIMEILWRNLLNIEAFDDFFFMTEIRYRGRALLLREQPDLERRLIQRELELLADLSDITRSKGVPLYVFIIPYQVQALKAHLLDVEKYDYQKPNRILKEFFAEREVPCLDFLDLYDQLERETVTTFYYNRDGHWSREGHEHAARALALFLSEIDPRYKARPGAPPS